MFVPLETGTNTLPNVYKLCHFNLTKSPLYLVKLKITQKQPTALLQHSVEPIVPNILQKVVQCSFLSVFVKTFL